MNAPRLRLFVAAALFCGWIGWLAYLAATTRDPIVLSRPQLSASTAHLVAELKGDAENPQSKVVIKEVLWPRSKANELEPGKKLVVLGLDQCGRAQGWFGPGKYILPVVGTANGIYNLTLIPLSPGYMPKREDRLRIYPATPETLAQIKSIHSTYSSTP